MSEVPSSPQGASWRAMLAARPLRNAGAEVEPKSPDELRITVRVRKPRWLIPPVSWVVPWRPTRAAELDRLGTVVWTLCDGERTVEQVVDEFADRYALTFHEARVAVTGYLKQLVQRGALAIEMPTPRSPIADCQLPIADCRLSGKKTAQLVPEPATGDRQSTIRNPQSPGAGG